MHPCSDYVPFPVIWDASHIPSAIQSWRGALFGIICIPITPFSSWKQRKEKPFSSLLMPDTCFNCLIRFTQFGHFRVIINLHWEQFWQKTHVSLKHLLPVSPLHSLIHSPFAPSIFPDLVFMGFFLLIFTAELPTYEGIVKISLVHIYILCSGNNKIELNRFWFRLFPRKPWYYSAIYKNHGSLISNNLTCTAMVLLCELFIHTSIYLPFTKLCELSRSVWLFSFHRSLLRLREVKRAAERL